MKTLIQKVELRYIDWPFVDDILFIAFYKDNLGLVVRYDGHNQDISLSNWLLPIHALDRKVISEQDAIKLSSLETINKLKNWKYT